MEVLFAVLCTAVISYLLGSFNSAILVVRIFKHKDIRDYGSHNAGLTNVLRCFGKGCAGLTLIGDLAKGIIAVLLCRWIAGLLEAGITPSGDLRYIGFIAGIFAILGHVFPIYYHFKGGKGVLVGVSTFVAVDWRVFLCLIVAFIIVLAISKYVSLGSMVGSALCPFCTLGFQLLQNPMEPWWYILLNTIMAAMMGGWVIWMHRTNIERLRNGNENKFSFHSKKEG